MVKCRNRKEGVYIMKKTEQKDSDIRFRVSWETKEKWIAVCEKNSVNGSKLLRKWIEDYIKKEEDKQHE